MSQICELSSREKRICDTVAGLIPLYSDGSQDEAASLPGRSPTPGNIIEGLRILIDTIFPSRISPDKVVPSEIGIYLTRQVSHAWQLLRPEIERALPYRWLGEAARQEHQQQDRKNLHAESLALIEAFIRTLPEIRRSIIEDVQAAYTGDPAALTYAEVQLAYPGVLAIASHRLAHELYRLQIPILPRVMSEWTHAQTGADIHPGAKIGHGFFIDHATGVVIGETTVIGNGVKIYQGVTLGAKSFPLDANGHPIKHIKRHPTVEDDVVIYAHATILGGSTIIGKGSTIGGNVFLTESIPPNSLVVNEHPQLRINSRQEV